MDKELKATGGAIIGFLQAKTPLVTLSVKHNLLHLNSGILGEYKFTSSEIVALKKVNILFSKGIKIIHNNRKYPNRIIFFCSENNRDTLIDKIKDVGFSPTGEVDDKNLSMVLNLPNVLVISLIIFLIFWVFIFYFF